MTDRNEGQRGHPLQRFATTGILLATLLVLQFPLSARAEEHAKSAETVVPVRLDRTALAGVNLPAQEPWPSEMILSGRSKPRGQILYRGEQLVVEVYEDEASKLDLREPVAFDEFIVILTGKLTLTDASGTAHVFVAGDSLVMPKGFSGTWHMEGTYRELIVMERKIYDSLYPSE